jgi:Copper binding periplasmic protein CusF
VTLLALCSVALAERRPHEGKIVRIDPDQKMLVVSGEKNDEWSLYWTETTKLKDVTVPELQVGDSIHFDYTEKDGKMWVTELRRTRKAKS